MKTNTKRFLITAVIVGFVVGAKLTSTSGPAPIDTPAYPAAHTVTEAACFTKGAFAFKAAQARDRGEARDELIEKVRSHNTGMEYEILVAQIYEWKSRTPADIQNQVTNDCLKQYPK
jgi:hypothetical protein